MRLTLIFLVLFSTLPAFAQSKFEQAMYLIDEGVKLNDNNQFEEGLAKYKTALDLLLADNDSLRHIGLAYTNIGYNYFSIGDYNKAISNLKQGLHYYRQADHTRNNSFVNGLHDLAVMYEKTRNIDSAFYYYQIALDSAKIAFDENDFKTVKFYNSAGYSENLYGSAAKAIPLFEKTYRILINNAPPNHTWLRITTTNLGDSYNRLADKNLFTYDQTYGDSALYFYRQALAYGKKSLSPVGIDLAQAYYNVAGVLNNKGRTDESVLYLDSAVTVNRAVLRNSEEKAEFYYRGAQYEYDINNYSDAKRHFLQAVEYLVEDRGKLKGDAWLRVAGILMTEGHFAEAKDYLTKVCDIYKIDFGENHEKTRFACEQVNRYSETWSASYIREVFKGMTDEEIFEKLKEIIYTNEEVSPELELIAEQIRSEGTVETMALRVFDVLVEFKKGNFEKTLQLIQNAFVEYIPEFKDSVDFDKNPILNGLYPEPGNLYSFFILKALVYHNIWMDYKDEKALLNAFHLYEKADTLFHDIRLNSIDEDKVNIGEVIDGLYKAMAIAAASLYELTGDLKFYKKAFYASEKARTYTLLSEAVDWQTIATLAPDSLMLKEKRLKEELLRLRKNIISRGEDKEKKFDIQVALASTQEHLKEYYPKYWEVKYSQPVVDLTDFLNSIDDQTLVVSYNLSKNGSLNISYLGKDHAQIFITEIEGIQDSIDVLNSLIRSKSPNPSDYLDILHFLSSHLLPIDIPDRMQNIIVIPDGKLHHIPFELLLSDIMKNEAFTFNDIPFLIKKYTVSYGISASHIYKQRTENNRTNYPEFLIAYNTLQLKEMEVVEQLGDENGNSISILRGEESSKSDLLNRDFSPYQILQISAHGNNWDNIAVAGMMLYSREIVHYHDFYSLDIPTDLVVLMGCGTAKGDIVVGEGLLGLNRALITAGTSNILMSKYEPDSETASLFTKAFYEHIIVNNASYSSAVRRAQLKLLAHADYAIPWYWSGFQLIGH